ncbi:MAG: DUF2480 family protein [Cyclobacteriaceae bacterium]
MTEIVNRVSNSPIVTIDLEHYYVKGERSVFDLESFLFKGMVLKELDFRKGLKELDWSDYQDKYVAVMCSADVIIPKWAYMLAVVYLNKVAREVVVGDRATLEQHLLFLSLQKLDLNSLKDKPVVIKGCSKFAIPDFAYGEIVRLLMPLAKSIMFGEPCSTVPVYKKPRDVAD